MEGTRISILKNIAKYENIILFCDIDIIPKSFIFHRCDFDDTAQYRASAMNVKGELSAYASVVVKSRFVQIFIP